MAMKRAKIGVLQERTNTAVISKGAELNENLAVYEPQLVEFRMSTVSQTAPTPMPIIDEPISQHNTEIKARRSTRYSKAEQALAETFSRCTNEPSSSQLQIETLQKATSILNAHAMDAREGVERLRGLLAHRETERDLYESIQRQRWMEERRGTAAEELSKVLQQQLASIPNRATQPTSRAQPSSASNVRFNANLVKFLETSRHRASLRSRYRRRAPRKDAPADKAEPSRIYHHRHLLPLRLGTQRRRPFETPAKPSRPTVSTSEGSSSASDTSVDSMPPPSTPDTIHPSLASPVSSPTSAPGHKSQLPSISEVSAPASTKDTTGTATIWRESLRSKEEILAGLGLVVSIPDYVNDLLAGLDTTTTNGPSHFTSTTNAMNTNSSSTHPRTTFHTLPRTERPASMAPPPRLHKSPSKRRLSALLSLPEALSSRTRIRGEGGSSSTSRPGTWRLSSPPSAFPSSIGGSAAAASSMEEMVGASSRPSAVSFSGFPSASATNLSGRNSEDSDGRVLSRLRRRFSVLKSR